VPASITEAFAGIATAQEFLVGLSDFLYLNLNLFACLKMLGVSKFQGLSDRAIS
jgi:hypothetical protein